MYHIVATEYRVFKVTKINLFLMKCIHEVVSHLYKLHFFFKTTNIFIFIYFQTKLLTTNVFKINSDTKI